MLFIHANFFKVFINIAIFKYNYINKIIIKNIKKEKLMNKIKENFFLSMVFFLVLASCTRILGWWNPFKKESWESLGGDIKKGIVGEVEKLDIVKDQIVKLSEPRIKGWAVLPTANTKLHEFMWVCSHNSFSSRAHNYGIYRQQNTSMVNQLKAGVRGLMLDTWVAKGEVRLTHGSPKYDKLLRPFTFTEGMKFVKELKTMKKEFFDKDRQAVVFFILEDHVTDRGLLDRSFEQSGLAGRILKPSEWNPVTKKGWPTIGWMNGRGKQIIVFSGISQTKYIYSFYQHVVDNDYGKIDNLGAASESSQSRRFDKNKRYLYMFNFFKDPYSDFKNMSNLVKSLEAVGRRIKGLNYAEINSKKLRNAINYAIIKGPIVIRDRYPNFLAIDFIEQGDVFGVADEFNRKASVKKSRVFRVMTTKKIKETKALRIFTGDN